MEQIESEMHTASSTVTPTIPRASKFNLTPQEENELREKNISQMEQRKNGKSISEQDLANQIIIDLYYRIGMEDFWIYRDVNRAANTPGKNPPFIKGNVIQHMVNRAEYSARLQVLLEDMAARGLDVKSPLDPQVGEPYSKTEPFTIYHGTAEPLNTEDLGKPNENGVYSIRDGISYWTPSKSAAEFYAKPNPDHLARGITSGKIHEKTISPGDICCTIAETHGGAFAMWQDEILELCKSGVKYLFSATPHRKDVLDIENFADFVQKRDMCLLSTFDKYNFRLPLENESLTQYIEQFPTRLQVLAEEKEALAALSKDLQSELNTKNHNPNRGDPHRNEI